MAHNDRKRDKRQKRRIAEYSEFSDSSIHKEKQKARDLRKSAWWKKKISSGICHYCGREFSPDELTMDHKIPIARGGKSEKINLVPACKICNNKKKYLLPHEWEEYMEGLKNR